MNAFEILRITRKNILSIIEQYSLEQLNQIPPGFNNNLAWNLGHVVVTQQLLCYRLSGVQITIEPSLIDQFKKGTKPEGPMSQETLDLLKKYAVETVDQMEADHKAGLFKTYKTYTTSFGITLDHTDKAIEFNNVHEGMHLGTMIALKKMIA